MFVCLFVQFQSLFGFFFSPLLISFFPSYFNRRAACRAQQRSELKLCVEIGSFFIMETELRELEMNQIFLRSAAARFVIEGNTLGNAARRRRQSIATLHT